MTKMVDFKANFKKDKKYKAENWVCDACNIEIETQSHVLECSEYRELRGDKKLEEMGEIVTYFQKVLKIRLEESRKNKKWREVGGLVQTWTALASLLYPT